MAAFGGGWVTFGLAFLAFYVIEDLKAYVISPRAEGRALNMDPLLTLLAVLAGTVLLRWQGALIAVPFVAMLQVVFEEEILPERLGATTTRHGSGRGGIGGLQRLTTMPSRD